MRSLSRIALSIIALVFNVTSFRPPSSEISVKTYSRTISSTSRPVLSDLPDHHPTEKIDSNPKQHELKRRASMDDLIAAEGRRGLDFSGLSQNPEYYFLMREAEMKHGRIAMLAAFGWPVSELYHYQISSELGLQDLLAVNGRAPSVLNGGLDNSLVLLALATFFAVGAILELQLIKRRQAKPEPLRNFFDMWNEDGWDAPGNYGFGTCLAIYSYLSFALYTNVAYRSVEVGRALLSFIKK